MEGITVADRSSDDTFVMNKMPSLVNDRMIDIVTGLEDESVARLLHDWVQANVQSFSDFIPEAVKIVQGSRAGRSMAIMAVMKTLLDVYGAYLNALQEKIAYLSVRAVSFRKASPAGAPQPGDVRTVFSMPQVYVDGDWWELGSRCEP